MAGAARIKRPARFPLQRADAVLLALLSTAAVLPFRRLFVSSELMFEVAGAAALALVVTLALSPRRPLLVALAANVAGMAAYLVLVVFRSGVPTPGELGAVWEAVTGSWAKLLTASLPAVATPVLTALPVLLVWIACVTSVELAARRPWVSSPVLPPLGALLVSLAFAGKRPAGSLIVPLVIVALALVVVLFRANATEDRGGTGAGAAVGPGGGVRGPTMGVIRFGLPVVVVTAAIAVGLASMLPLTADEARFDLHDHYRPPVEVADAVSPLTWVGAGLRNGTTDPLFTVAFKGIPPEVEVDRVRVAVLDQFDGTVWGTHAEFAKAGRDLPPPPSPDPGVPTVPIHQDYVLDTWASSFLPSLDRPRVVTGTDLGYDRVSGTLVGTVAPRSGLGYGVDSDVPTYTDKAKKAARAGNDPSVSALALSPPQGWPATIRSFSDRFVTQAPSTYERLRALEDEFKSTDFGYAEDARPGHNLGVLSGFLDVSAGTGGDAGQRVGSAEQFASAFAVLARVNNLPSRVIVGYRVDPRAARRGAPIAVTPKQIHAWPEVHLNGVGWVSFDPTNPTPREAYARTPNPTVSTTTPDLPVLPGVTAPGTTAPTGSPGSGGESSALSLWPIMALGVLIAAPVAAKKARRRRRRHNGIPARRVMGAWCEARDRLRANGIPVDRSLTVAELAARCTEVAGPQTASRVAVFRPIVDDALYAVAEPGEAAVEAAWQAEAGLAERLNNESNVRQRVRAALDPRPLVRSR